MQYWKYISFDVDLATDPWKYLDLVPALIGHPPAQSQLVTFSNSQPFPSQLHIGHNSLHWQLLQQLNTTVVLLNSPYLYTVVNTCSGKYIALLDIIHSSYPALAVSILTLKYRFSFPYVPEVDWTVLTSSNKSLLVDGSHPVNGVVVTFEDHLCLSLGFPCYHLLVVARTDEIVSVEVIHIQNLCIVLVVCANQTSLREIPVFQSQISTDRTNIIGVNSKFDAIDSIFMSSQSVNKSATTSIPQFDLTIISSSSQHILTRMQW